MERWPYDRNLHVGASSQGWPGDDRVKDIVQLLVRLLEHESPAKRAAAAIIMGELAPDDAAVLEALRRAGQNESDPSLRRWVVEAIGQIAPKSIVKDLQ